MKITPLILVLAFGLGSAVAFADQKPGSNPESPSDGNMGEGNDPPGGAGGAPSGQTTNPNPSKLLDDSLPVWMPSEFVLAQGVNDPPGKPSGPQGPGQHGSPGPNGNSGP